MMVTSGPLISVIIPCYNQGHFIAEAILSVQQDKYPQYEIIVVDDGSSDNTAAIAKGFGYVTYIYQENQGLAAARNNGIAKATGKYVLPLDSDNKINPEVFLEAAQKLESDDTIDVVYTDAIYFGDKEGEWVVGAFNGNYLLYANYIGACALIRKETLLNAGLYDGNIPAMGNEDWELWIRLYLQKKKFFYFPKAGFCYRVVTNSMSATTTDRNYLTNKTYVYQKYAHPISEKLLALNHQNRKLEKRIGRLKNQSFVGRLRLAYRLLLNRDITK